MSQAFDAFTGPALMLYPVSRPSRRSGLDRNAPLKPSVLTFDDVAFGRVFVGFDA